MSLGFDLDAIWSKTPAQVALIFSGKSAQLTREHNERAWLAWHTAGLPRYKTFPALRKLLIRDRTPQSADKMQAIAKQWIVQVGGKVEYLSNRSDS